MKTLRMLFLLMVATFTQAQVHPFVAGGVEFNGAGQTDVTGVAVAGVQFTPKHFYIDPEAQYINGGKTNDNDNTSSAGHTRYLKTNALVKIGKYYVGPGVSYAKLYTPDYIKSSVHPRFTVGRDFESGYVDRLLISYVNKGTDTANGMQGFDAQAYWFFGTKHVFLRMDLQSSFGHATVIPVSKGGSTQSVANELATRVISTQFQTVFGVRF